LGNPPEVKGALKGNTKPAHAGREAFQIISGALWIVLGCVLFHVLGLPYLEEDYELGRGGSSGFT
jgi:hypothetical protein